MLLSPDNGRFLLLLVWAAAWALWAWITLIILSETISALRGITPPKLPGGSLAQPAIRILVTAAIGALIAAGTTSPATALPAPDTQPAAPAAGAVATAASTAPVATHTVTVERGDTLWSLAGEHLDDPQRWPELYELNQGIEQPTGYALDDPDQIDVGWILKLPTATVDQPAQPDPAPIDTPASDVTSAVVDTPASLDEALTTETPPPSTTTVTPESAAPHAVTPKPVPIVTGAPTSLTAQMPDSGVASPQDDVEASTAFSWQVAGLLGAGSFLGAGVAALLARRRREQFRTRRPGRIIAAADPQVAPIEKTAHIAAGLSARLVNRLDAVLRRIHGTIDITSVSVTRDGTITLASDDTLGPPWTLEPDGWLLPNTTTIDQLGEDIPDAPCGYPLLVTIGTDSADRVVLINLETIGRITITGDQIMRADFTRYLAAELAVNPWSASVRVSCHGPAADAIAMAPDRLDADDTEILTLAQANHHRSDRTGHPTWLNRATQAEEENWGAGVIVTPHEPGEPAELIATHPGRTGIALVTHGMDPATLTLTASGRVTGLGMELTAVGLTEDEAAGCALLLTATTNEDQAPPPADNLTDVTGNLLEHHRSSRHDPTATPSLLPDDDEAYLTDAAVTSGDLAVLAPRLTSALADQIENRDPTLDDDVRAWFSDKCPYPRLSLLGPVKARCYGKPMAKQKAYYTEALAYLALHPTGVTGDQLADAFGLTVPRARTVISNLRQWVGINPRTGDPHIPDAKSSPEAQARGVGLYLVQDILVDIDLFRRLRARAIARGADGIDDLETALELVQGRPFDQLRPAGWTWLFEGDRTDHHMICAIGDVAHLLVTHHLHSGDFEAARRAATIALHADSDSETAKLDLAAIMVETGHSGMARQVVSDALGEDADLDLTPRAFEVAAQLRWLSS